MTPKQQYKHFIRDHSAPWCWLCGRDRTFAHKPLGWYGTWLLERAHIASSPRLEDVRLVVILCSLCHGAEHGLRYRLPGIPAELPKIGFSHLLWLKREFDGPNYDRAFIRLYSVASLPRASEPDAYYRDQYRMRRGA